MSTGRGLSAKAVADALAQAGIDVEPAEAEEVAAAMAPLLSAVGQLWEYELDDLPPAPMFDPTR